MRNSMDIIQKTNTLNSIFHNTLNSIKKDFIETLVNFMVDSDIVESIEWQHYKRYNDSTYDEIISIHHKNFKLEYTNDIVPKNINDDYYLDYDYDNNSMYGSNGNEIKYSEKYDKIFNNLCEFTSNIDTEIYVAMFGMNVSVNIDKTGIVTVDGYYHD